MHWQSIGDSKGLRQGLLDGVIGRESRSSDYSVSPYVGSVSDPKTAQPALTVDLLVAVECACVGPLIARKLRLRLHPDLSDLCGIRDRDADRGSDGSRR